MAKLNRHMSVIGYARGSLIVASNYTGAAECVTLPRAKIAVAPS
jgi:hypothetical protein